MLDAIQRSIDGWMDEKPLVEVFIRLTDREQDQTTP